MLGYNGTTLLPMVRTCSERTQRFSGSTTGTPPVLLFQPCAPVFNFVASGNTRQYNIWVELVAGPGTTQTPDQMQTIVVNATNSGVLVPVFAVRSGACFAPIAPHPRGRFSALPPSTILLINLPLCQPTRAGASGCGVARHERVVLACFFC